MNQGVQEIGVPGKRLARCLWHMIENWPPMARSDQLKMKTSKVFELAKESNKKPMKVANAPKPVVTRGPHESLINPATGKSTSVK